MVSPTQRCWRYHSLPLRRWYGTNKCRTDFELTKDTPQLACKGTYRVYIGSDLEKNGLTIMGPNCNSYVGIMLHVEWNLLMTQPIIAWHHIQCDNDKWYIPPSLWYKTHLSRQLNCWSLRCSWSIACRRCSNYIIILDLTPGFNGLGKDNCKTRRESLKFCDLVWLILEILQYFRLWSMNSWRTLHT